MSDISVQRYNVTANDGGVIGETAIFTWKHK